MIYDQAEFAVRCEWGLHGVIQLAPISDAVIIVDVYSFSTAVDIATRRGAVIYPFGAQDETAVAYATSIGAQVAAKYGTVGSYSLSPHSLAEITPGTRLVLPSRNGARLSLATRSTPTLAACLRNYRAVAAAAQKYGENIAVIPAGERWPDGALRPAFEDWIGAGAVISCLDGPLSPEAAAARAVFRDAGANAAALLAACSSSKELLARGLDADVALATDIDVSDCAPLLVDGAYRRMLG
jgi:2-phosphosulfolactate phosphatase